MLLNARYWSMWKRQGQESKQVQDFIHLTLTKSDMFHFINSLLCCQRIKPKDHFTQTTLLITFLIICVFTDAPPASLLSHCMVTWPIYQCEVGLERRAGNEMNWMAVKALGQSALVVMWDIVNRLLLDCNWTVVSLSHFTSQVYLPCVAGHIYMRECNIHWQLTADCLTVFKALALHTCDLHVSYFYSNKSWWICTLLLGRMQQCKCRGHLLNTLYTLIQLRACIWHFFFSISVSLCVLVYASQ